MLCWPLDSKDSTRWHHDIFMTSWHSPDWFLRKKNRGWWLVTCIFPWYDPYHPWSSGVFSASTCLKRCDWLKRPEQSQEAVQCSSSLSDVMLPLPWRNSVCFFWAGPQSQWSMQNRLFGCEHSNWPRCKSLGFPKTAFFTQFSVRLLATQSVSKFSCQVLIQNKLYIAMYIHTWLYIYIFHNSYTILHTHKACYVSSQVAKNPSAWWVICGVFSSPGCNVLDRRFKSCGRCYNMSSSKARSGRDFCRRSGWARWIYWDEPKKRIWVCYFCWDVCGEVWWNATDYLGPKRFGNRSRTAERKEHFQEEVKHRNV